MFKLKFGKRKQEINELLDAKHAFVNQRQPFSLFLKFVTKNMFLSVTNILFILFLPIVVFLLSVYLYPFYEVFSTLIIFPPILIGIILYSRAIYRYRQQSLFIKKFSNYAIITLFYFLFSIVWSAIMFGIFILLSVGFWKDGVLVAETIAGTSKQYSPALIFNNDVLGNSYLNVVNWPSLIFTFFQTIFVSMSIGLFIALICYRKMSLWIIIILLCIIIFSFSLLTLPPVYRKLPIGAKYLTLVSPLTSCFNLSSMSFNGVHYLVGEGFSLSGSYNPFNVDQVYSLYSKVDKAILPLYAKSLFTNWYNLIAGFAFGLLAWIGTVIIALWNMPIRYNYKKDNQLFISLNNLNRTSSFKSLFLGIPESFKLDGMDSPYKNYIIYVKNTIRNKLVFDILTNKVRTFRRDTIEFNNLKALYEIQPIIFNDAVFSGIRVQDFLEYYKRLDFIRYQEVIKNFNFSRLLKIRIEYLDYDSLFYLYAFIMLLRNKKIFLIDNYSLSKISTKVIDIIEKNNFYYWLITNIN